MTYSWDPFHSIISVIVHCTNIHPPSIATTGVHHLQAHPQSLLVAYNSCRIRSFTSSVHDLLDVPVALSQIERVCTTFIELVVARRMTHSGVGRYVRVLENVPDRGDRILLKC